MEPALDKLRSLSYKNRTKVKDAVTKLQSVFSDFTADIDKHFISPTKQEKLLVLNRGLTSMQNVFSDTDVPLRLWLPKTFPAEPPVVCVPRFQQTWINAASCLQPDGRIRLFYLDNWSETSTLVELVLQLSASFRVQPPVFNMSSYSQPEGVKTAVQEALGLVRSLKVTQKLYECEDGIKDHLVLLKGHLLVEDGLHEVPIEIAFTLHYPKEAPIVTVVSDSRCTPRPSLNLYHSGKVKLPFLKTWEHSRCSIKLLVLELVSAFSKHLPIKYNDDVSTPTTTRKRDKKPTSPPATQASSNDLDTSSPRDHKKKDRVPISPRHKSGDKPMRSPKERPPMPEPDREQYTEIDPRLTDVKHRYDTEELVHSTEMLELSGDIERAKRASLRMRDRQKSNDLMDFATSAQLTEETVDSLMNNSVGDLHTVMCLQEGDIRALGLPMGQYCLLRNAVRKLQGTDTLAEQPSQEEEALRIAKAMSVCGAADSRPRASDDLMDFATSAQLVEQTVNCLVEQSVCDLHTVMCLQEEDMKALGLPLGQYCLLRDAVCKLQGTDHKQKCTADYENATLAAQDETEDVQPIGPSSRSAIEMLGHAVHNLLKDIMIEEGDLTIGHEIGRGQFGIVYKGILQSKYDTQKIDVAVKTVILRSDEENDTGTFIQEVFQMRTFSHKNVMALRGLYMKDSQPFVILPYMVNGNLKNFVKNPMRICTVEFLLGLCLQVAQGMEYLATHKFIHGDLAARNCLVDGDEVVKVSDFGMAHQLSLADYYKINSGQDRPLRWMAVESLTSFKFTLKSDVWSFGVLMWEVLTRGQKPYAIIPGISLFIERLEHGHRLPRPDHTPYDVYELMMKCWDSNQERRPTFTAVSGMLKKLLCDDLEGTPLSKITSTTNAHSGRNVRGSPPRNSLMLPKRNPPPVPQRHADQS